MIEESFKKHFFQCPSQSSEQLGFLESLAVVRKLPAAVHTPEPLVPPHRSTGIFQEEWVGSSGGGGVNPEALAHYAGAGREIRVTTLPTTITSVTRQGTSWPGSPASAFLSVVKPKLQPPGLRDKVPALYGQGMAGRRERGGCAVE